MLAKHAGVVLQEGETHGIRVAGLGQQQIPLRPKQVLGILANNGSQEHNILGCPQLCIISPLGSPTYSPFPSISPHFHQFPPIPPPPVPPILPHFPSFLHFSSEPALYRYCTRRFKTGPSRVLLQPATRQEASMYSLHFGQYSAQSLQAVLYSGHFCMRPQHTTGSSGCRGPVRRCPPRSAQFWTPSGHFSPKITLKPVTGTEGTCHAGLVPPCQRALWWPPTLQYASQTPEKMAAGSPKSVPQEWAVYWDMSPKNGF